ncbi:MAG: sarcosine oxidase subunit delta [Pseudomonadota bacterium]
MLLIHCPCCGPRNESEFIHGGPSRTRRPADPSALSDEAWIDYLTVPHNPMGPVAEKWWHARGCGLWTTIMRDTVTHEILPGPAQPGEGAHG